MLLRVASCLVSFTSTVGGGNVPRKETVHPQGEGRKLLANKHVCKQCRFVSFKLYHKSAMQIFYGAFNILTSGPQGYRNSNSDFILKIKLMRCL